jgi:hypothetical protein
VLNCQPHDVPVLVAARLLKPLGNPQKNDIKFFATAELLELVKDQAWLVKVTNAVNRHWQKKNASKKDRLGGRFTERARFVCWSNLGSKSLKEINNFDFIWKIPINFLCDFYCLFDQMYA